MDQDVPSERFLVNLIEDFADLLQRTGAIAFVSDVALEWAKGEGVAEESLRKQEELRNSYIANSNLTWPFNAKAGPPQPSASHVFYTYRNPECGSGLFCAWIPPELERQDPDRLTLPLPDRPLSRVEQFAVVAALHDGAVLRGLIRASDPICGDWCKNTFGSEGFRDDKGRMLPWLPMAVLRTTPFEPELDRLSRSLARDQRALARVFAAVTREVTAIEKPTQQSPPALSGTTGKPDEPGDDLTPRSFDGIARADVKAYLAFEYACQMAGKMLLDREAFEAIQDGVLDKCGLSQLDGYAPSNCDTFSRQVRRARGALNAQKNRPRHGRSGRSIVSPSPL